MRAKGQSVAILLVACACTRPDPLRPELVHVAPAGPDDPVVATVDGEPIHLSRVMELSRSTGRPPREVAEGMVQMTLLAHEATDRGLCESLAVRRVFKKAMVQLFLEREVESKVDPDSVTADEVKKRYVDNFANKGVLFEDAWRDIWMGIVAERRRVVYEALVKRLREKTPVRLDDRNVSLYVGHDGV